MIELEIKQGSCFKNKVLYFTIRVKTQSEPFLKPIFI